MHAVQMQHATRTQVLSVGPNPNPTPNQVLSVGGSVWHCALSIVADAALLRALLARTAQQPCRTSLPSAVRTTGDAVAFLTI